METTKTLVKGQQFTKTLPAWIDGGRKVVVTVVTVLVPFGRGSYNGHDFIGTWVHSDGKVRRGQFYLKDME